MTAHTSCAIGERTAEVGRYKSNGFGLHDMHGNVWEWVEDCYQDNYNGTPTDGSARTSGSCDRRVLRGGSWSRDPRKLRSATRGGNVADGRFIYLGFRVGRTLAP
jgi:formylglycine-generating enzyme required for sulfatase activity